MTAQTVLAAQEPLTTDLTPAEKLAARRVLANVPALSLPNGLLPETSRITAALLLQVIANLGDRLGDKLIELHNQREIHDAWVRDVEAMRRVLGTRP